MMVTSILIKPHRLFAVMNGLKSYPYVRLTVDMNIKTYTYSNKNIPCRVFNKLLLILRKCTRFLWIKINIYDLVGLLVT